MKRRLPFTESFQKSGSSLHRRKRKKLSKGFGFKSARNTQKEVQPQVYRPVPMPTVDSDSEIECLGFFKPDRREERRVSF